MRIVTASSQTSGRPAASRRWASGVASLDQALGGGLAYGRVHEFLPAEAEDAVGATGLALAMATGMTKGTEARTMLWLRSRRAVRRSGLVQAHGWADLGGQPGSGLLAVVPDTMALLRAAVDALRCAALGAVIVEDRGPMPELDLTASRRLALAAEQSGVPLFLLRLDARQVPSAAQTRWQVAAAPSQALPGHAPGLPSFDIALLRQRSGPAGLDWRLEWDRDRCIFREPAQPGAVVSLPAGRSAADPAAGHGDTAFLQQYVA